MIRKSSDLKRSHPSSERERLVRTVIELVRATADQTDRLDQLASARFGLNPTDSRALELVSRTGPLTPKALAEALGMTTGGVTTVIDRLEQAGYARRRHDSTDRRSIRIEATDRTWRVQEEVFGELIRGNERLVKSYRDSELEIIRDFLERSGLQVKAAADRIAKPRKSH